MVQLFEMTGVCFVAYLKNSSFDFTWTVTDTRANKVAPLSHASVFHLKIAR